MADLPVRLAEALKDRYTLERELGRGGMATVYLAQDLKHHRPVALKVLAPELAAVLGPERFLQEIEVTARLNHPHILPLLDSGQADGFLYYVMPFAEGESLRDRLRREKQLPVEDALQIAREVADALAYAHRHHVVHRDIKPENILLQDNHAVVADFGIARAIGAAGGEKLTATGVAVGTPEYMSPEQAAGEGELDGRSDTYALGCVLYEMLAGQPPFMGPTVEVVLRQHLTAAAPAVTAIRTAVPAAVNGVIQRALAKTPADRFSSAARFAAAIPSPHSIGAGGPTVAIPARRAWRLGLIGVAVVVVVGGAFLLLRGRPEAAPPTGPAYERTAIAVLPFENLSSEGPYAYFAGALHAEILTQLFKVAALKPISGTSVAGYVRPNLPPLKQIARELKVGSVVEGNVQVVGARLRVNVRLIDAATDAQLWAMPYERRLDDAFAIQSEVAQQIVTAVGATLGGAERTAMAQAPTANAEAYRLYLQGLEYRRRPGYLRGNLEVAQGFFERAVALDSTFALAHAALSRVHGWMSWTRYDASPARLARQAAAAETAHRLAPDLPQAHLAMGEMHYRGHRDWRAALEEYQSALEGLPNDADVWNLIGNAQRRLGHWDEALAAYDKVADLDPRDYDAYYGGSGLTLYALRRYREAMEAYGRSLALAPDVAEPDLFRGWTWVLWQGRLDSLASVLDRLSPDEDLSALSTPSAWQALRLFWERKPDSLLALLGGLHERVFDGQEFYLPTALYAGWAHRLRGDGVAARVAFDSARVLLDSAVAALPDDWRFHAARGLALAGLARRPEALREARWLQQSAFYRDDAAQGPLAAQDRARILAQVGESSAALDEIQRLLAGPSSFGFSVQSLRLDPLWDPLRGDPRFQALVAKYEPLSR